MELIDYVRVLRRRWVIILVVLLSCIGGAAVATIMTTPQYTSSGRWLLVAGDDEDLQNDFALVTVADRMVLFAGTASVTETVRAEAGIPADVPLSLSAARPEGETPVLDASATSTDPALAQQAAEAFPEAMVAALVDLGQLPSSAAVSVEVLNPPGVPSTPVSPDPIRNLAVGALLGLVLGLAAAFVREALDVKVRDASDVESLHGLPVVGEVPTELQRESLPARTHPESSRTEAYRQVRAHLMFSEASGLPGSILVTSANPGEGKTSLAVNLGELNRASGQTVVVIDADLRRPAVDDYVLGVRRQPGLSDYLLGKAAITDIIVDAGGLHLIPSGPLPRNPSELVGSTRFAELIQALCQEFDLVIVDGPPVLPVADAIHLSVMVQGVVVCARQRSTTRSELRRAKDLLERMNARIYGVVLMNSVTSDGSYGYRRGGYGGYSSRYKKSDLPVHDDLGGPKPYQKADST